MVIFSRLFFSFVFFFIHVHEPIENRVFREYLSKNIIFSIWQCGTVSRTQLAVFCFRYRIQERDCRSRGLYAIYMSAHMQTWRYIVALAMSIVFGLHAKLVFFFTRATRRNSKCVTRLFQWTTLLSEMYMRKTVKVGNIVQCYTCYDIYAPIMVILFADVKFTHSVTSVRFALSYTEKN